MIEESIFIGRKEIKLSKKTAAELEHLLQLAKIEKDNYAMVIRNYPPDRMIRCGIPYMKRLDDNITLIQATIDKL